MDWVKDALKELKINGNNEKDPFFAAHSPVSLTEKGTEILNKSGLKKYIDAHKKDLLVVCDGKEKTNPYEVQEHVFKIFSSKNIFSSEFYDKLKQFAFNKGTDIEIVKRIGAIYFRDICLSEFKMNGEDIDKHKPER